jgi:hypothetical protein
LKTIYCEAGALTPEIKRLGENGTVALVHFPYDPCSHTPKHTAIATPSGARFCDLNLPISDLPGTFADYSGSVHFAEILSILGDENWQDALHVDSAFKQGCIAFVTPDRKHILKNKRELECLLGIKFFHQFECSELEQFVAAHGTASI